MDKRNTHKKYEYLSRKSTIEDIRQLMETLMASNNGDTKRTLRKNIRQAKNKETVIKVICEYLNKEMPNEKMEELLLLAIKIDGVMFLNQALQFYRNSGSDYSKLMQAYKGVELLPEEAEIILAFISTEHVYDANLRIMLKGEYQARFVQIIKSEIVNGNVTEGFMKMFGGDIEFLDSVQEVLYDIYIIDVQANYFILRYLDFSYKKNQELLWDKYAFKTLVKR